MEKCIHCGFGKLRNNGKDRNNNQRYQCTRPGCEKRFIDPLIKTRLKRQKRIALHMYLLGYSSLEISQEINIEAKIIDQWVDRYFSKINHLLEKPKRLLIAKKAYEYISTIDKGQRPERVNKNNPKRLPIPKKSNRK